MCGRFNSHLPKMHGWASALEHWPAVESSYNVTPTSQIAAFKGRRGRAMRWGMVAPWANSFDSKFATFNARIETVEEKATFQNAWLKSQRCVIPMAGYFEWKSDNGIKQPYYIQGKDQGCLAVAGLYEQWGDGQLSCTILTTSSQGDLEKIHGRMPILLTPTQVKDWIYGDVNKRDVLKLISPNIISYPVSSAIGKVSNDYESLLERLG